MLITIILFVILLNNSNNIGNNNNDSQIGNISATDYPKYTKQDLVKNSSYIVAGTVTNILKLEKEYKIEITVEQIFKGIIVNEKIYIYQLHTLLNGGNYIDNKIVAFNLNEEILLFLNDTPNKEAFNLSVGSQSKFIKHENSYIENFVNNYSFSVEELKNII